MSVRPEVREVVRETLSAVCDTCRIRKSGSCTNDHIICMIKDITQFLQSAFIIAFGNSLMAKVLYKWINPHL